MKNTLGPFLLLCLLSQASAWGRGSEGNYKWVFEGFGGLSSVKPTDLNSARESFIWNATSASSGTFNNLLYLGGSVGRRLKSHLQVSIRYEQSFQVLPKTDVGSSATVVDYFMYSPILMMVEFPFTGRKWSFSLGGGVGYSLQYEFHQQYSGTQEDITYSSHPLVFRGRISLGYSISKRLVIFAEGIYDKVSADSLETTKDYQVSVNGSTLTSGQTLKDSTGSNAAKVDMSGIRYGLGLRLVF